MAIVVYLDVCCLKRPFDDQRSTRVQLETLAIAAIVERAEGQTVRLVKSPAHVFENERNPREDRRLATALWLDGAHLEVGLTDRVASRARELGLRGFAVLDALHTAFAEEAGAAWLVTTDDRLVALGQKHATSLTLQITNPTALVERFTKDMP